MKRLSLVLVGSLLLIPTAHAAPSVTVKAQTTISNPVDAEGLILSGNRTITFTTSFKTTSDISISATDSTGNLLWSRTIDAGVDEIATSATVDSSGNIWLAGAIAQILPTETPTLTAGIENPDAVIVDSPTRMRADLGAIGLWKLSPNGDLLAAYQSQLGAVALVKAISVSTSGASIVGMMNGKAFLITTNTAGVFSKPFFLGSEKTSFNDVMRTGDGSSYIYGSSSETLLTKKVAGKVDGLLLTVDKNNKVTQLVRSSAPKALRQWQSADATFVTTGSVVTGNVVETALTQFTKSYKPTWTLRLPSTGTSLVTTGSGLTYLALASRTPISGLAAWKPTTPTLLVIAFDAKGVMKAAYSFPGLTNPQSLKYTRESGVVGLALNGANSVSIFRITSR